MHNEAFEAFAAMAAVVGLPIFFGALVICGVVGAIGDHLKERKSNAEDS